MPTSFADGSQTCVINTEHFVSSPNVAGVFHMEYDLSALAAGDVLEVRVYKKIRAGGTARECHPTQTYYGVQPAGLVHEMTLPVSNVLAETDAVRFSIRQTAGTGRAIPWNVHQQ